MGDFDEGQRLDHLESCDNVNPANEQMEISSPNPVLDKQCSNVSAPDDELETGGTTSQICREKNNCQNNNEIAMNGGNSSNSSEHLEEMNGTQEENMENCAENAAKESLGEEEDVGLDKDCITDSVSVLEDADSQVQVEATTEQSNVHVRNVLEEIDTTKLLAPSQSPDTNEKGDASQNSIHDLQNDLDRTTKICDDSIDCKENPDSPSNVFNERISSDGGSVEIAEEAEESQTSDADLDVNSSESCRDDEGVEHLTIQHSTEASPATPVAIGTKDDAATDATALSSSPKSNLQNSLMHGPEDVCHKNGVSVNAVPESATNSDRSKGIPESSNATNTADESYDQLMSELAAELDEEPVPPKEDLPEGNTNGSHCEEESRYDAKDKSKLAKLADEWKKKYCHAEAELQSLRVAVQAKSQQLEALERGRAKVDAEVQRETEAVKKVHLVRIKELQKEVELKKKEMTVARDRQMSHDIAAKKAISQLQQEMVHRVDKVKQMYEEAIKEKETMVIRYAKSEKENLDLKKAKGGLEKKQKDAGQGLEVIATHNKQLKAERAKLMSDLDAKDVEITRLQKEMEQMKDDVSSASIKVKWAQNKLKMELENHKETKIKLAKTEQRLNEAKEETGMIRKDCQDMIKTYQESEEMRSNSLDIKLREKEEELKQHFLEKEDHMELHKTRLKELDSLKKAHHDTMAELDSLKVKAKCLEEERLHTEGLLTQFKGLLNSQKDENRKLSKQMDELKSLKRQLDESKENCEVLEKNMASQKEGEKDLETELERSRQKESELLQFTEKMTSKNTSMHSENSSLSSKVDSLTEECKILKADLEEAKAEISQLTGDLNQERQYREREAAILSARLSEKTKALDTIEVQLDDAKDENKTLKRKHNANIKDLTRQLQHAKKKIESFESTDGSNPGNSKDTFSSESRTSSTGSLDTLGNAALNGGTTTASSGSSTGGSVGRYDDSPQASQDHTVAIAGSNDFPGIDKAMLVDRIVRLQKQLQRKGEKTEFLQEHITQLVEEVQKKSKIIQQFIMREESGALIPASSDVNKQKLVRKTMAQMSKQSGIMASLYRSHPADPNMNLDLSLEINRKLQAVLEDTLLKNITLKENIDTLGQEIARLSEEAQLKSGRRSTASGKKK